MAFFRTLRGGSVFLAGSLPLQAVAATSPSISTQPHSQSVVAGSNAVFNVVATGQTPLLYQWLLNGVNVTNNNRLDGATNSMLAISNVAPGDAGLYLVVIRNSHGTVSSSNALLTVLVPAGIGVQPTNMAVLLNGSAGFTATATGAPPLSYRWYFKGAPLNDNARVTGSTTTNLAIFNVQANDAGAYQWIATNTYGAATSAVATLTVLMPAFFLSQPSNLVATLGSNASLTAPAGGTPPLNYRWYFNGTPMTDNGRVSGSSSASLHISDVQWQDAGSYQVGVSNQYGGATSAVVVLGTSAGAPGVVRFVNLGSTTPAAPYTDWSTASTNIQDTVDVSADGDFIFVTNGVYSSTGRVSSDGGTNCLAATNAVTIQSVRGPEATWIDGGNQFRCANLTNSAALVGFTLANGSAAYGGGAVGGSLFNCRLVANSGGAYYAVLNNCNVVSNYLIGVAYSTLSNCVITANSGSGAAISTLVNCVLQNNSRPGGQGGGANQCTLTQCVLSGNQATYGGGANSCTLFNCTLRNNTASWGGGAISSTLNDCLVVGNVAHNRYPDFYAASLGGGVWAGVANNCTIVGNSVVRDENSGGNYYSGGGAYGTELNNCIVYYNSESPFNPDGAANYGGGTLSNCCTAPLPGSGSGNFGNDPLLVNLAGGDYHLQTNSPCINAGNNAFAAGVADLDGNPRIIGQVTDVGAYEFPWPTYFTLQPRSQVVSAGQSVFFSAAATGPLPVSYQWLRNGSAIAGATTASLTLTNAQLTDDGAYSVMVSNATVVLFSTNAVLSVIYPPPGIVSQPVSQTILAGTSVQFSVAATSQVALAYQWLLNGANLTDGPTLSGSTGPTLNLSDAQAGDPGNYQVIVMNDFGAVSSAVATLTVLVPAAITTQPASQSVVQSNNLSFTAEATGTAPLISQWYFHGAPLADGGRITGATTPTLSVATVTTADAGPYQLVVTNGFGAATSQVATLTVLLPPMIVAQPTSLTVQPGSNAGFTVTATGPGTLSYQWLLNGVPLTDNARLSGSSTATLSIQGAQAPDNGTYQVTVANSNGVATSVPVLLTILAPPVMTQQPPNLFEPLDGSAAMTVGSAGAPPLSYQWLFNGVPLSDNDRVSGTLSPLMHVANLLTNDQGAYQVIVTNAFGSITSAVATLHVLLPGISAPGVVTGWGRDDVGETDFPGDATNLVALAAGYIHALALRADGTVAAWGESYLGATAVPPGLSNVVALAGGDNHSLALKNDGTVVAWGYNGYGETNVPAGLSNVVAITAGNFFSLALKSDGTVTGWGDNGNSQVTEANYANNVTAIAAHPINTWHALGLKSDGTVVEWGLYAPPVPSGLHDVVRIACGGAHYIALKRDGTVVAWGDNSNGQTDVPAGLTNVVAIVAGSSVSLALTADGTIAIWGDTNAADGLTPLGLAKVTALASGGGFNLALNDGTPSLVLWPGNRDTFTGMPVNFTSAVTPSPVASLLQWQFQGTNLPHATGTTLTLTNVQLSDAGLYSLQVSNAYGTLNVNTSLGVTTSPPLIVKQPANQVVAATSNATFNATAAGSWPLAYQWQCGNTAIPGATNATLVVSNAQLNQSGVSFALVVSNSFGMVVSSNAILTVLPALVGIQPQDLTTNGGATVTLTSTVIGQGPFSYQWQFFGTNLPEATNATLTLTNALARESGAYSVTARNSLGVSVSPDASMTVVPWIAVSISPSTITSGAGKVVVFSFNVGGLSSVNYQWTHDGKPWPGGPNPGGALDIIEPPISWAGTYNVSANDDYASVTSSNVTLTIIPLAITNQPQSRGAWLGGTAQLRVSAIGAAQLSYQWRFNGTNLPGATTNPLILANMQPTEYGPYDVMVSNPYSNMVSATAVLGPSQVAIWGFGLNGETNLPLGLTNIIAISTGLPGLYDCQALRSNGTLFFWPTTFPTNYTAAVTNLIAIAGANPGFGLRPNGQLIQWPSAGAGGIPGLSNVVAVSSAANGFIALKNNGTVSASEAPAPLGLSNVVAVSLGGGGHGLALRVDGTVAAWGNNNYGQATVPLRLTNVIAVAAGGYHSLALKGDGTVVGWGLNASGQTNTAALGNVVAIAAGLYHSLALKGDGTVTAWGLNDRGQSSVPSGLTNVQAIAAGPYLSMALIGNGPPPTQALLSDASLAGSTFRASLPSQSGRVYGLEYKNSFSGSSWTLPTLNAGNGATLLLADPGATNGQRFYRVRRW